MSEYSERVIAKIAEHEPDFEKYQVNRTAVAQGLLSPQAELAAQPPVEYVRSRTQTGWVDLDQWAERAEICEEEAVKGRGWLGGDNLHGADAQLLSGIIHSEIVAETLRAKIAERPARVLQEAAAKAEQEEERRVASLPIKEQVAYHVKKALRDAQAGV
jgi:hypothetical protein